MRPTISIRDRAEAPAAGAGERPRDRRLAWPVVVFLIALLIPLIIQVGPLRLSVYRLVLLAMFLPCVLLWLSGRAGPIRKADICVVVVCIWSSLSIFYHHGLARYEAVGIFILEVFGAYLMGRCFIRTPEQFLAMTRLLFVMVLLLLPFGLFESLTGTDIALRIFKMIGRVPPEIYKDPRLGLDRAQGPFEHPILFGVFCASALGLTYYVLGHGQGLGARLRKTLPVMLAAFTSLSSGPLSAVVSQIILIGWDRIFQGVRQRWNLFIAWCVFCYVAIDLLSNRTPVVVLIHYLAFSAHTGMNRIRIWDWGTKNIFDNPLFGLGFHSWERLYWMTDSADMVWVVYGMRHGILVWVLFFAIFFLITGPVAYRRGLDERVSNYRMGYLVSMMGLFLCGWMVHFYNQTLVIYLFLLASGVWILDHRPPPPEEAGAEPVPRKRRTVL